MGMSNNTVVSRWSDYNEGGGNRRDHAGSGSITFAGPVLRSYRTPIARYYKGFVLVTSQKFGVTTAHHINMAYYEAKANMPVFRVPYVGGDWHQPDSMHQSNIEQLTKELEAEVKSAIDKYRVRYGEPQDSLVPYHMADAIRHTYKNIIDYARWTNALPSESMTSLEEILKHVERVRNEKWAVYMDPKAVLRRERAQARRQAKIALGVE